MARFVLPLLKMAGWEARGLPNRALILNCEISNPNKEAFYIADAWLAVLVGGGPQIAEGRLFHAEYDMVHPVMLLGGNANKVVGQITIPLSASALATIEAHRNAGDLLLRIDSRVLFSPALDGSPAGPVLTAPYDLAFSPNGSDNQIKISIPQSDWVKALSRLAWSEIELMELPADLFRSDPRLARSRERLKEAQSSLARGDWEGVLQDCRKAYEAAAMALTGEEDRQAALPKLKDHFGESVKAENLNAVASAFSRFLHLGRHEQSEPVTFDRADAILVLRITASLLDYLARK